VNDSGSNDVKKSSKYWSNILVEDRVKAMFRIRSWASAGRRMISAAVCLMALLSNPSLAQSVSIEVVGLMKNTAVVAIDGQRRVLKVGQASADGVLLLSADTEKAVVSIDGESRVLYLSRKIASGFTKPKEVSVSILRNDIGQYAVGGSINGRAVRFLVDTGANVVALNGVQAKSLGLDYERGKKMQATTAAGVVPSYEVLLDNVQVGAISVTNVAAVVLPGDHPTDILLGMTFLERVVMREEKGVLLLISKF
tara:strand:+ start:3307 stop:4065 length:759 start_codon:yes stop_codon:yes gene_type:complete